MGEERVSHCIVALGRVACAPVKVSWRGKPGIVLRGASTVGEWAWIGIARLGDAVLVLIDPFCWDIAVVVFEIIDIPSGESDCVEGLVAKGCGVPATGLSAVVTVDADLETEGVNLLC